MFKIFKKKSEVEKLEEQYAQLLKDAHRLSTMDRKASDLKAAEAEAVRVRLDLLIKKG